MNEPGQSELLRTTLGRLAPGTALRDGLERILRGRTGGLIVLGHDSAVESICDGGFRLDVEFSATRLRELSKMDGAVVLSTDASRILRANVQLVPDPTIPTEESGTRHRTAERSAIQTGHPVISVSQSMSIVSVYVDGRRHVLTDSATILSRANQALATLERYKARLDEVTQALSALEIEDFVTVKDAMTVAQRLEMVRRISAEIDAHVIELGADGRLIELQLDELVGGLEEDRELLVQDYLPVPPGPDAVAAVVAALDALDGTELLDVASVAKAFGYPGTPESLDDQVSPRGYRLLARVPRLPGQVQNRLVEHFGSLQALLAATADDLQLVDGVGDARARVVREGLSRMAETSIVDRYG
ncbi:DNA integrity scanning protein DisA [Longimycelium tulufanense]|uniref:DNA integrity scanning protein DisA n=1 Tax=Longimycelium tulufanense TaxID=907463 RepID=A0A8J3FTV5_9PSEU|nr:DNA integrity scanning diadenylate cyclase DisA [Longimycelium tulufanense]GGM44560.1 DNA integrity scanning protein DisA [Longimycelium tulufanense]